MRHEVELSNPKPGDERPRRLGKGQEGASSSAIVYVNPFRCRVWLSHDRLEEHITVETCRLEIESFQEHGQLVPVLGRRVVKDPDYDIELIYGARRLFIARHLNKPLAVEIRDLSDKEAIIAMDMENRLRRDISGYERGISYARWLREGFFGSQEEIARALKISASQVSRLLKLARLPAVILDAFGNPQEICEKWGQDILALLEDGEHRRATIQTARAISSLSPRPPADVVYRRLLASRGRGRKPKPMAHDKIVKDASGAPLFRVRNQRNSVALILPVDKVSAKTLTSIESSIAQILEAAAAPRASVHRRQPPRIHEAKDVPAD